MNLFRNCLATAGVLVLTSAAFAADTPPADPKAPTNETTKNRVVSAQLADLLQTEISLSLDNAGLHDATLAILKSTHKGKKFASRGASPFRISTKVEKIRFGDALNGLAQLANRKLYVLDDTLLLAPDSQISAEEKARAIEYSQIVYPAAQPDKKP